MNVVTRGMRNAFRNVIRTFSIIVILGLSMGLALSMLIANKAVEQKITSVKSSVGNTITVSPAGARGFEGGGTPLTNDEITKVQKLSHVTAVNEILNDRLTTDNTNLASAVDAGTLGQRNANNNGQGFAIQRAPSTNSRFGGGDGGTDTVTRTFTPPVIALGVSDPNNLASQLGGSTITIKVGKLFAAGSTSNDAVIGSSLATKNNLKVGSTFTAYTKTVTVVGIYDAGNTFANNQVVLPLASLQTLSSQTGDISSAIVTVDSVTNVDGATTAISNALGSAADVTNNAESAKESLAPLENIKTISLYSLIGAIVAGSVIILLTMIMIVRERRREIGVYKAIGASNVGIISQFVTEAVTLTVLASVIGIGLGVVAGGPITKLLVNNSASSSSTQVPGGGGAPRTFGRGFGGIGRNITNVHATVGWSILLYGLAAAVVISIVGSTLASFAIAKIRPAEVMRTE